MSSKWSPKGAKWTKRATKDPQKRCTKTNTKKRAKRYKKKPGLHGEREARSDFKIGGLAGRTGVY